MEIFWEMVLPVYIKSCIIQELINRNIEGIKNNNLTNLKILQIETGAIGGYVCRCIS